MRFFFVLLGVFVGFHLPTQGLAFAQKAADNVVHPLLLFNQGESEDLAQKADCAVFVVEQQVAGVADEDLKALSCLRLFSTSKQTALVKIATDAALTSAKAKTDKALASLGVFALRSSDEKEIIHYGLKHAWLFSKIYAQFTILPDPGDIDTSPKKVVAKKICSAPKKGMSSDITCGPLSAKPASFRQSYRRLFHEHHRANRTGKADFDYVRFFGFYVEDLTDPAVIKSLKGMDGKPDFKYTDDRSPCPSKAVGDTHDRSEDYIFRAVMNCARADHASDPNYQVLLAYEPGSSLTNSKNDPVIMVSAPKQPWIVGVREGTGSLLSTNFENKDSVFPSQGALRLAKNPDEFIKSKTENGITLGVGIDRDGQQEDFEIDAAIGYRLANKVKPDTECDNPHGLFCRTQISMTPFLAWQRETSDNLKVTPAKKDRDRDVVFTGVQYGFERITELPEADLFTDHWSRPNWRVSGALEAITDGNFDAEVYRLTSKISPPGFDTIPNFGYRQPTRLGDLLLSHKTYRENASANKDSLNRCANRALCSVWLEWDGGLVLEEVSVRQAPLNLDTDEDLTDRLVQFEGTRFGYDLSAKIGTRSLFAFKSDKPWVEFSVDYKNRQSWNASEGQAELFETSLKLKDTLEGLFSVGVSYERGEELRLGEEIENWTIEFDMKR